MFSSGNIHSLFFFSLFPTADRWDLLGLTVFEMLLSSFIFSRSSQERNGVLGHQIFTILAPPTTTCFPQ